MRIAWIINTKKASVYGIFIPAFTIKKQTNVGYHKNQRNVGMKIPYMDGMR